MLSCLLQREEVRQENAVWVSAMEAMEVVELEKQMGQLKGPGVGVGTWMSLRLEMQRWAVPRGRWRATSLGRGGVGKSLV